MKKTNIIQCPECNCIQRSKIEFTWPFPTYIHECNKCKYIIMESEWNSFNIKKYFKLKYFLIPICNLFALTIAAFGLIVLLILTLLELIVFFKIGKTSILFVGLFKELIDDIKGVNFFTNYYFLNF